MQSTATNAESPQKFHFFKSVPLNASKTDQKFECAATLAQIETWKIFCFLFLFPKMRKKSQDESKAQLRFTFYYIQKNDSRGDH